LTFVGIVHENDANIWWEGSLLVVLKLDL